MKQLDLDVQSRQKNRKNANRRMRRSGRLPAVIYGEGRDPQTISVDGVVFGKVVGKLLPSSIINLKVDGESTAQQTIIREIQRDPVFDDHLVHIDFFRISIDKPIEVEVPVHAVGATPIGVKSGGVLEHLTRLLLVKCLPLEVPASIDVDLSDIDIGRSIHVFDIEAPEGVEILNNRDTPVFAIAARSVVTEEDEEKEEEAIEGEEPAAPDGEKTAEQDSTADSKTEK